MNQLQGAPVSASAAHPCSEPTIFAMSTAIMADAKNPTTVVMQPTPR